jgi:ABC-2 type transport system ATP-binding protein
VAPGAPAARAGTTIILTTHYIEEAEDMADRIGVIRKGELIVVEDKAVLMRQLGRKELALSLQHPLARVPESLAHWPLQLSADGLTLTYGFDTQKDDTGIAELLATLATQGIAYKDLRTSESSLEDIFVSLVHDQKAEV